MTFLRFLRAFAVLPLLACGGHAALPFEGTWTGTLTRSFECLAGGGSLADVPVSWTVSRLDSALSISTGEADCPTLTAGVDLGDDTLARLDVAHCTTTTPPTTLDGGVQDAVTNTRTWTDGRLRLRNSAREMLVDVWEHDEGTAGTTPYVCDGMSFGALALEGG